VNRLVTGQWRVPNIPIQAVTIFLALYVLLALKIASQWSGPWSCAWASSAG